MRLAPFCYLHANEPFVPGCFMCIREHEEAERQEHWEQQDELRREDAMANRDEEVSK